MENERWISFAVCIKLYLFKLNSVRVEFRVRVGVGVGVEYRVWAEVGVEFRVRVGVGARFEVKYLVMVSV